MRALLFILLCLAAVPSMGLDVGEGRRKGPKYPLTYYLVNPELPCPLNVSRENDSVLRLWVDGPQSVGLSAEESEEWLSYETPGHRDIRLLENITDRFRPTAKVRRTRSRLLEKWTGLSRIKNYSPKYTINGNVYFINGYPMIETRLGNPYTLQGTMGFPFIEDALAHLYPGTYLQFLKDADSNGDEYDMEVRIGHDIMRVQYFEWDSGMMIVDKYAIDLLDALGPKNPGIRIGKLVYTTRGERDPAADKKAYEAFKKACPLFEGKRFQMITLDSVPLSNAYIDDIWLIRMKLDVEKRTFFKIDRQKGKFTLSIDGKEIPWDIYGNSCGRGDEIFRGDRRFEHYENSK